MASSGPIDTQVLDRLCNDVGDDRELVRSVIGAYLERIDERCAAIRTAIAAREPDAVVLAAHALASPSLTVGVRAVFAPVRAIEDLARFGDMGEAEELLGLVESRLPEVRQALSAW